MASFVQSPQIEAEVKMELPLAEVFIKQEQFEPLDEDHDQWSHDISETMETDLIKTEDDSSPLLIPKPEGPEEVPELKFQCPHCNLQTNKYYLNDHIIRRHPEMTNPDCFACPKHKCQHRAKDMTELVKHILSHSGKPPATKSSPFRLNGVPNLEGNSSSEPQLFQCPYCDLKTKKSYLSDHIMRRHPEMSNPDLFECPKVGCNHRANDMTELLKHILIHSSEKPVKVVETSVPKVVRNAKIDLLMSRIHGKFKCTRCTFTSSTIRRMEQHMIVKHMPEHEIEWLQCEQCDHKTKTKQCLRAHVKRSHAKGKEVPSFYCSFKGCDFKTNCTSVLRRHSKSHDE